MPQIIRNVMNNSQYYKLFPNVTIILQYYPKLQFIPNVTNYSKCHKLFQMSQIIRNVANYSQCYELLSKIANDPICHESPNLSNAIKVIPGRYYRKHYISPLISRDVSKRISFSNVFLNHNLVLLLFPKVANIPQYYQLFSNVTNNFQSYKCEFSLIFES